MGEEVVRGGKRRERERVARLDGYDALVQANEANGDGDAPAALFRTLTQPLPEWHGVRVVRVIPVVRRPLARR